MALENDSRSGVTIVAEQEEAKFLLRVVPVEFTGPDFEMLKKGFCAALGVKRLEQVRIDLLVTDRRVIAAPATRDRSGLAALGVLLGTGGLGAAAVGLLSGVAELAMRGSARANDVVHKLSTDSALAGCAVWDRNTVAFEVFEQRDAWDVLGGEWSTSPRFAGPCRYRGDVIDAAFEVPFGGRFGNVPLRSRPTQLEPLLALLGYDISRVQRRSTWRKKGT